MNIMTFIRGKFVTLICLFGFCLVFSISFCGAAYAQSEALTIHKDVVYGNGAIEASGESRLRALRLDAYVPLASGQAQIPRPAIILAFGGAYHRGGKGHYQFSEDGASDSSMADYCQALARRGVACFSIDYRLTPEDPKLPEGLDPSKLMSKALLNSPIVTGRVEIVRKRMGLPPLGDVSREQLWNATFAAIEDMRTALGFIKDHAKDYNIDAQRIALGGFSAGAMTAINLAYGEGADVQAVIALSGTNWGYDLNTSLSSDGPPLLMFAGQWDLPGIKHGSAAISKLFAAKEVAVSEAWVPNFGHFYPMEAPSLASQFDNQSVIDRIAEFLDKNL